MAVLAGLVVLQRDLGHVATDIDLAEEDDLPEKNNIRMKILSSGCNKIELIFFDVKLSLLMIICFLQVCLWEPL